MLIDWFTVGAQIFNFLILVYLLKRFLFGPIVRAMEKREKNMVAAMARATEAEQAARKQAEELDREKQVLLQSREEILSKAKQEVDAWQEKAVNELRAEIDTRRKSWMDQLAQDRQAFVNTLKKNIAQQVMAIGQKVLKDLADQDLDQQIIRVFLEKVKTERKAFSLKDGAPVTLQTGLPLTETRTEEIRGRLQEWFPKAESIRFEAAADLGIGLQVLFGDHQVAWNLTEYLNDLEKEIMAGLFAEVEKKSNANG